MYTAAEVLSLATMGYANPPWRTRNYM